MTIKLTKDKAAAVNMTLPWLPVSRYPPPRGVKLLLIDKNYGVAILGVYQPDQNWTHWQALPHFNLSEQS